MAGTDKFTSPRGIRNIGRILARLERGRATCTTLMDDLCMGHTTAKRYLKHLQELPDRRIRIAAYERTGGRKAPLFAIGSAKDAPCPPRDDRQTRRQRERAAIESDLERKDRHYAHKRVVDKIRRTKERAVPQTWLSALM